MVEDTNQHKGNLDGDIESANIKVALAKGREALDEAFDIVSDLIERAPKDRKVMEIAKRLALKDRNLIPQFKRIYRAKNIPFMEESAERLGDEIKRSVEAGDFDNAQRIFREAEASGLAEDPIIRDRFERAQTQYQQESQGIVVPPEIRIKLMRARSTYRGFDYTKCIDLCTEGLDILESFRKQLNSESYQYLHKELVNQMDQAQFMLDRRNVLLEGYGRINKGNWEDARDLFKEALGSFAGDDVFEKELDKLEQALKAEAEFERQASQLRAEITEVDNLIDLEHDLANLPIRVSASTPPTERQQRIRESLSKTKRSMITQFKKVGSRNLELSRTAITDAEKRKMLIEAREHITVVEKLDADDVEASGMLADVMRALQQIDIDELARIEREKKVQKRKRYLRFAGVALVILFVIAGAFSVVSMVFDTLEQNRIKSEQTAIAQDIATGTAIINIAILTANANSTNVAVEQTLARQTQDALSTINAITAVARATDIVLTANAQTAEARQTQQSIEFALMTATQSGVEAQTALRQTQVVETATISAIRTQTASAPTATYTPTLTPTPTATPLYICQGVVTITQGVNVRERPSVNSPDVGTVHNGALVEIYSFRESTNSNIDGWYQIVFLTASGSGQGGWIASNYVAPIDCPEDLGN